jgi:hypothetical protein
MRSWKVWLLVLAIFASGVAAGAFGMRAYLAHRLPELLSQPRERLEDRILANIDSEVSLSPAQRTEIRPLIEAALAKAHAAHQAVRNELEPNFSQLDEAIAARLDPGQKVKFAELRARMKAFRKALPPGSPPPGPPPDGLPFGPPPGPPPGPPAPR